MVLTAYRGFSGEMADIAERFFTDRWIDAPVRPGKAPGAFSHPTTPSAHPYVLMNYQGKPRDVMTLAHELGHGVHQVLAAKNGALMAPTPLTLAETASVFGEMLTFKRLLGETKSAKQRQALLAGKVEDMINTVVRQIAFYSFERAIHTERKNGELTAQRIGEIWLSVQGESLGPAIDIRPGYENFWMYIPHFIHSPFYVYAYAFGDCLVNSLYAVYENAADGFAERYLAMLAAGGTKHYSELLKPFGLDAKDPQVLGRRAVGHIRHDRRTRSDGLTPPTRGRDKLRPSSRPMVTATTAVGAAHDRHADATQRCLEQEPSWPGSLVADRACAQPRRRFRRRPPATTATKQRSSKPKGRTSSRPRPSGLNCLKRAWRGSRSNWSDCVLSRGCKPLVGRVAGFLAGRRQGPIRQFRFPPARSSVHRCGRALPAAQRRARRLSRPHPPHPCEGAAARRPSADHPALFSRRVRRTVPTACFARSCWCGPPRTPDGSPGGSTSWSIRSFARAQTFPQRQVL